MDQDPARTDEEQATQRRARVLGMEYVDTSQSAEKPLYRDILTNQELYDLKVIPVRFFDNNLQFGVTTTTSQQTMASLRQRFVHERQRPRATFPEGRRAAWRCAPRVGIPARTGLQRHGTERLCDHRGSVQPNGEGSARVQGPDLGSPRGYGRDNCHLTERIAA